MEEPSDNVAVPAAATQDDIATRLAALNRWQEEQKRLLEERQNSQRLMLGLEQRNMYEMLGLLHKQFNTMDNDALDVTPLDDEDSEQELEEDPEEHQSASIQRARLVEYQQEEEDPEEQQTASIQRARLVEYQQEEEDDVPRLEIVEIPTVQNSTQPEKPKRAFLRRGEGLKQRFKVDPDKFRLENLPRYKFANAHSQLRTTTLPKRGILKTQKEPLKIQELPAQYPSPLTVKEKVFQQLLMNDKNVCSSTPDLKSSYASSSSVSPKVRFVELSNAGQARGQSADDEQSSCEVNSPAATSMCWAKILKSPQSRPVLQQRTAQIRVENDDNVSIFELLEQKAREGNIDMNSSCIRTFMARKEHRRQLDAEDDSDQIVVTQQLREMRLQPEVSEIIIQEDDDDDNTTLTMSPHQMGSGKTNVRVRFSDSNDTHEYSTESSAQEVSNVQLFEEFKTALFKALDQRNAQQKKTAATEDPLTKELQIKANLVRTRLQELETEIATFKEQNLQLVRLKQQHELDQAKFAQDHMEAMERVHDEKIQAEIYLHDERMKIEEERRKFEQQMRLQKSNVNSKEKKQLAALQQEIEALQQQLKQKEQTHVSAQARLRAQLRASDKEQRGYRDEIELLGRENKRLEQELIKISRESNSKMLQEINRNIARLAPKLETATSSAKHTDENGKRHSKSPNVKTLEKPDKPKQRVPFRRLSTSRVNRKNPEPLNESNASSSSCDMDELFTLPKATKSPKSPVASNNNNSNNNSSTSEFKREIVNADGSKDIWYPNGNLKKISADGMSIRMLYFNKDIKETDIRGGTTKYYYAETNTWHTTYVDGLEILEFPNGQTEHRHKSGIIEIHFPNNTIKTVDPNDAEKSEEWRYADGTHLIQLRNGDKILNLPNGQKEIHTKLNKRREYPDGTVKIVYPDESQETRYSNGRVRLKDKDGKLIMDTDYAKY